MNKQECLDRAAKCFHQAHVEQLNIDVLAHDNGWNSVQVREAMHRRDYAIEVGGRWERLAAEHPSTRAYLFRKKLVPAFMREQI